MQELTLMVHPYVLAIQDNNDFLSTDNV